MRRATFTFTMPKERFLGRLNLETLAGLEDWAPSDTLVELINELRAEGKL
jgi:hypothetical protein